MMCALAAMQDRIDEPRPVASFVAQVPSTPIAPADPAAEEQPEQPEVPADDALRAQRSASPTRIFAATKATIP